MSLYLPFSKLPLINQNPEKKKESLVLGLSHESAKSPAMQEGGMPGYKGMHSGGNGMYGSGGRHGGGMHEGGMYGGSGGYHSSDMHTPGSGSEPSEITWTKNIKLAKEIK